MLKEGVKGTQEIMVTDIHLNSSHICVTMFR